jgi:oxidase EvaA
MVDVRSALLESARITTIDNHMSWWDSQKQSFLTNYDCSIEVVPLQDMNNWHCKEDSICHETGRFFSIKPYFFQRQMILDNDHISSWCQPVIDQPEIGFLGFLTFIEMGVLKFLVQLKIEPGNQGYIQLSPTIQATKSNFEQVHGGNVPNFLRYFKDASGNSILYDQIQSEQGSRFFRKRNRNMIVFSESIDKGEMDEERFVTLTLLDLKKLMQLDNVVNMDTRTVLSNLISLLC